MEYMSYLNETVFAIDVYYKSLFILGVISFFRPVSQMLFNFLQYFSAISIARNLSVIDTVLFVL